ncbi:MAG: sugar ABC transporter substrate-binding protein [Kangiellaceae bacterium]|nr:sugar ABC transporter substrate-binding protein [Kangiellaceae bacterium]
MVQDGSLERILSKHGLNQFRASNNNSITLTIGIVNNPEMNVMRELSTEFEERHPDINLEWKILTENTLRRRLMSDLAISEGQFDVMMIGPYEAPIWAKNGWLKPIVDLPEKYDLNDLLAPIRQGLSYQDKLYALPFYGESSITFYRKDLFDKAGIKMPLYPTYSEIMDLAKVVHAPQENIYGIALRGKAGWGQNMIYISTLINTFGGRWFDEDWNPTINTPEWKAAITYYDNILKMYGSPNSALNGWQDNRDLFAEGKLGIMVDASVLAATLNDPNLSKVHGKVGFSFAPTAVTPKGSHWLWSWALAVPSSSKQSEQAMRFLRWATSKEYIKTVVNKKGWGAVPPGTRHSTYQKEYLNSAPFADLTFRAIKKADPRDFTLKSVPYTGIGFVHIPEYPAIGRQVGIEINKALRGIITVEQALDNSQKFATEQMKRSGYIK